MDLTLYIFYSLKGSKKKRERDLENVIYFYFLITFKNQWGSGKMM